jgi:hypothetical protein
LTFRDDDVSLMRLKSITGGATVMGFCCFYKPDLVMDSGTRKGRALVIERRQSMTFFYGGKSDEKKGKRDQSRYE